MVGWLLKINLCSLAVVRYWLVFICCVRCRYHPIKSHNEWFWLISFVVLCVFVVSLGPVELAIVKEIESLRTRLESLTKFLGISEFSTSLKKYNLPIQPDN